MLALRTGLLAVIVAAPLPTQDLAVFGDANNEVADHIGNPENRQILDFDVMIYRELRISVTVL